MIGLKYILNLYGMEHQILADKLGIKKQNINLWVTEKQRIPQRHLPVLAEIFDIDEGYFQKELDDVDKLVIQKEKLRHELKPRIVDYETELSLNGEPDLYQKPIYSHSELNSIEIDIEKAQLIQDFKVVLSEVKDSTNLLKFTQLLLLLKRHKNDELFNVTIDALSYYYNILPEWVGEPESDEFVDLFLHLSEEYLSDK
ncbi:helix-turn-helix domain-containing protein [Lentibacillus cibarius]|uniref:Helix-turn-helix transcriptional regulator n=1 Tax=Lentibacillus cibarius TaxID=2583219 RepID=A0A5S3QLL6_9BACI|nr:helix-turn-helix transcriptional regulator [Lentibacillus cibarius]TMN22685.1 helix-turn-helix transcriptional regulator [Lentibacillus cibarius]